MYIKEPSDVLVCDIYCRTFQGGGKKLLISLTSYLTIGVYGSLDKIKLSDQSYTGAYVYWDTTLVNFIQNLSNILSSRLTLHIQEITGDHQCWFQHNRSTTDQILCIKQMLENKWEYNGTVHQLFMPQRKPMVQSEEKYYMTVWLNSVNSWN
jgi:hypothetical protein